MNRLPSYGEPPVSEVVFGVQFSPIEELLAAHIGLYWKRIRDRFPRAEEQAPIGHIVERFEEQERSKTRVETRGTPPLPRTWLISEMGDRLLQVQRDRFLHNWREKRRDDVYPRYGSIKKTFLEAWDGFQDFLIEENLPSPVVDQYELTYVNHIRQDKLWQTMGDLSSVFSCLSWAPRGSFLPAPEYVVWQMRFALPDNQGRLRAEAIPARLASDTESIIRFSLTARGISSSGTGPNALGSWYDLAHEWIVKGFSELVSEETDEVWEREQ